MHLHHLRCEWMLATAGKCADDVACCGLGRMRTGLEQVVGVLRAASRGAAVRAGNEINSAGAASLAPSLRRMTQLTSLDLGGTLCASAGSWAVSGCLRTPAAALMMLRAVGWDGCARGWSGWWGFCEGRAEGRRCVQAMPSEMMEQRRWHRVSQG